MPNRRKIRQEEGISKFKRFQYRHVFISCRVTSSPTHHSGRRGARQPSPPTQPSQAEVPVTILQKPKQPTPKNAHSSILNADSISSDPFIDSGSDRLVPSALPLKPQPVRSTPTISSRPNGTLASRRKGHPLEAPATPTPVPAQAKAVPFPAPSKAMPILSRSYPGSQSSPQLSRSDPVFSHIAARPPLRKSSTFMWDDFPICDDVSEYGGDSADATPSAPSHRVRSGSGATRSTGPQYDDGPRTAPLLSGSSWAYSPQATPSRRYHQRAPSEGVFTFDEPSSTPADASEELRAFIHGLSAKARARNGKDGKPFFASSMFQNSPSPDELPPPSFAALL
jgi:hypothetical protein